MADLSGISTFIYTMITFCVIISAALVCAYHLGRVYQEHRWYTTLQAEPYHTELSHAHAWCCEQQQAAAIPSTPRTTPTTDIMHLFDLSDIDHDMYVYDMETMAIPEYDEWVSSMEKTYA